MHVVLPDNSQLELPDGATGLDAARAIGPKLAEQAVLIRAERPACRISARRSTDGAAHPDPHHARHRRPGRALRPAPLRRAPARRGGAPALPGREDRDRPADRERLLLRLRLPGADQRRRPRSRSRTRSGASSKEGRELGARGDLARRGAPALPRGRRRAVQGRARRHRRGRHHALHPGRLHRPLPRPAPAELEADQGVQADRPRRRLLARRREEQAADPHLRHRVLLAGRPRRAPRAARGGAQARPPPARRPARPLPPRGDLAGLAVLAPEGDGDLERARGPAPPRERAPRLRRGEDAADLRQGALGAVGPLGEVPREHVPDPRGRPDLRDQADELPGAHAALREHRCAATASCRSATPRRRRCTATSGPARCTASPASGTSPRTTRTSSAPASRSRTRSSAASTTRSTSTTSSGSSASFELSTRPDNKLGTDEEWDFTEARAPGGARPARARVHAQRGRRRVLRPEDRPAHDRLARPLVADGDDPARQPAAGAPRTAATSAPTTPSTPRTSSTGRSSAPSSASSASSSSTTPARSRSGSRRCRSA